MNTSWVSSMYNRFLPASLVIPLKHVFLQGLDDDLRSACEEVISSCVNPLCEPLDEWVMRVRAYSRNSQPSTAAQAIAAPETTAGISAITSPTKAKGLY